MVATSTPLAHDHHHRAKSLAAAYLLAFVLVGYPAIALISSAFNWNSVATSVPFRIAVIALSLWLIANTSNQQPYRGGRWLFSLGLVYLLRLVWDTWVAGIPGAQEALIFYVATVLIPAIALWRSAHYLSEGHAIRLLFNIGSLICLSAIGFHVFDIGQDRSLTEATGRLSFESLNPISLGHVAATTLIAGLCAVRFGLRMGEGPWLLLGSIGAGSALTLSASRGPLLSLALASLVYAIATKRWHWLFLMSLLIVGLLADADSGLMQRIFETQEDTSTLERLVLQTNAFSQFLAAPVLGNAFTELELLTYPHNLFIETAMSMGAVGLVLLFLTLTALMRAGSRQLRQRRVFIFLLLTQYFIAAQLSGALFGNSALVACVVLVIARRLPSTLPKRHARRRMKAAEISNTGPLVRP